MRFHALVLLAVGALAQTHPEGWRLVRVSPEIEFWASPEQIDSLAVQNVGFADVTDTYGLEEMAKMRIASQPRQSYPTVPAHVQIVESLAQSISLESYENNLRVFSAFHNRHRDSVYGLESAEWLEIEVQAVAGAVGTVTRMDNPQFAQFNVICRIEGDGSDNNTVVIGAHQDSIAGGGINALAPGADDDGSGSMAILDLLSVLVGAIELGQFSPKRPIEFHWYAGEEGGLVGSSNMAQDYASRNVPLYSMMQLDMIGYPAASHNVGVVTDFVDSALVNFEKMLIDAYLTIGRTDRPCGYGCSDHASWTRAGYPAVFPFEAPFGQHNPNIHTARDTIENGVDMAHSFQFMRLGLSYLIEASLA